MCNCRLGADLEVSDQYSKRETCHVYFTNIKEDDDHKCDYQVVASCNELGLDVRTVDLVAAHPSPGKKTTRFIARFKDRATALRVFHNRKKTKNIDPSKKKSILAEDQMVLPSNLTLLQNVSVPLKHKHAWSIEAAWLFVVLLPILHL